MINVKATIFNTLTKAFDRMRLLGDNNTALLKKILFLVVLDDIYDWSNYLDDKQSVQKRLQELRANFILCNPEFEVCRMPFDQHYVNVNTPQTDFTWKRVWDAPDVKVIETSQTPLPPSHDPQPWEPDPTCPISVVYYDGEGAPNVDVSTLTTCEKMNIYINRETGTIWYLNTNGQWRPIDTGASTWTEDEILDTVKRKLKISHSQEEESEIGAELSRTDSSPIVFCTDQEVEDLI